MTREEQVRANERAIRAFLDGMLKLDKALVLSGLHDNVELVLPRPSLNGRSINGAQNLADFVVDLSKAAYVDAHASLDRLVVTETHGAAEWRLQATLASGGDYDQFYCWMFDLADGRITQIREYIDTQYGMSKNSAVGGRAVEAHART